MLRHVKHGDCLEHKKNILAQKYLWNEKMKIYVINLERSVDRKKSITEMARVLRLDLTFVNAVDGRNVVDLTELGYSRRNNRRHYGRLLSAGEVGCYASHLKVAEKFVSSGEDMCVVLEDDACIADEFSEFFKKISQSPNSLPDDALLINIGKSSASENMFKVLDNKAKAPISFFGTYQFPTTTRGLVWTRKGATEFLDKGRLISMPVDQYLKDWLTRTPGGYCLEKPVVLGINAPTEVGTGTGRRELSFSEALRYDIVRGKRDYLNNFAKFKRKLMGNVNTIMGNKN